MKRTVLQATLPPASCSPPPAEVTRAAEQRTGGQVEQSPTSTPEAFREAPTSSRSASA